MPQNPLCVYKARDDEEAGIIAAWLEEQGIETLAPEVQENEASILGLSMISSPAIEVCVRHEADVQRAVSLLRAQAEVVLRRKQASAATGGHIVAVCESCHETVTFPAGESGTVQDCPNCGEYVDVPEIPPG